MASGVSEFGETAKKLSQNPLGIIALFIVLVYGFASLVVGLGRNTNADTLSPLIWFMVLFPVLVLAVFGWLVSRHHTKLYAPKDYAKEEHFILALGQDLNNLNYVSPQPSKAELPAELSGEEHDLATPRGRSKERTDIYTKFRRIFLVHVLTPSSKPRQKYDIFIYAMRHKKEDISDIAKAEFFFGKSWGNRIFPGTREGNVIGVATSAYGSFLCTCLITFNDGTQVTLYRYVDFEMGEAITKFLHQETGT